MFNLKQFKSDSTEADKQELQQFRALLVEHGVPTEKIYKDTRLHINNTCIAAYPEKRIDAGADSTHPHAVVDMRQSFAHL